MKLKILTSILAWAITVPVLACNSFGPDYDPTPCPNTPAGPVERIPTTGWDYPYEASVYQNRQWKIVKLPVTVQVVDDFVVMWATLPNGNKVSGISNQCILESCPYLANFARTDMEYKLDAIFRNNYLNIPK